MRRILILGASGFLGRALYKELTPYFDLHGTYRTDHEDYRQNQVMHTYDMEKDSISPLLSTVGPTDIIYALKGPYQAQLQLIKVLIEYCRDQNARLLFLSSAAVFDAVRSHVSYETDHPQPQSLLGKHKTQAERILADLPKDLYTIVRLPLILGTNAPVIRQLRQAHKHKAHFEVFSNHIISAISDIELVRQLHYIVNRRLSGLFHLSSSDLIHHSDLFFELAQKLNLNGLIFEYNYSSNEDEYRALLVKENPLPKQFNFTMVDLIKQVVLSEEIITLRVPDAGNPSNTQ